MVICLSGCKNELDTTEIKQSLSLVFQDTFGLDSLDTTKWRYHSKSPAPFDKILPRGNCDFRNAAVLQKENIQNKNGILYLIAKHEEKTYKGKVKAENGKYIACDLKGGDSFEFNQTFTSASIFSKEGFNHGYFECRAKVPCTNGLYPVFWLWHHDEIVVFEFFGNSKSHFVSSHNKERYVTKEFSQIDYCKNFHNYGVYWTKENITWFLDEKPIWRICRDEFIKHDRYSLTSKPDNNNFSIKESFPDSSKRWLSPNISLRIYEWTDKVDLINLPDTLKIDYVKIYQNHSNE